MFNLILKTQLVPGWPSNLGFLLADLPHYRAMSNTQFEKATDNFRWVAFSDNFNITP